MPLLTNALCGARRASFEQQVEWMKLRDSFEQTSFDFIQLQHLDYAAALSCEHGAQRLTADGITIGFHTRLACFQKPYAAPNDSSITLGSLFKERIFVLDHELRTKLMQYASSRSSPSPGLTEASLLELCDSLNLEPEGTAAHALPPFLEQHITSEAGMLRPPPAWRQFLHALGTPAPTCQLLPLSCHPAARQLVDTGAMEKGAWDTLLQHSPVLHKMLQNTLLGARRTIGHGGVDLAAVQLLVKRLLEVSRNAATTNPWNTHAFTESNSACNCTRALLVNSFRTTNQPRQNFVTLTLVCVCFQLLAQGVHHRKSY